MPGPDGLQMLGFCLVVCGLCACGGRWRGSTFSFSTLVLNAFVGLRPNWLSSLSQVAMLSRDEEHLLKQHLSLWREIGDCFLIGLDSRNKDRSEATARRLLVPKELEVYHFDFVGFGPAKSQLLQESYQRFPKIDYVLLVEPDMRPVSTTFKRSALRQREVVYAVRRSGKESRGERLADSVFRNDGRWYFKFRVHESPIYRRAEGHPGVPNQVSDTGWAVLEVTGSVRDAQQRHKRIREELRLVGEDLRDYPGHPRLSYYAGALRYELAMELGSDVERQELAREAVKILQRRSRDDAKGQEEEQQRSAAAYFCGRSYWDLLGDVRKAEKWLKTSSKLERGFLYPRVALIQLLFQQQRYVEALEEAQSAEAELLPQQPRLFMDSGPLHVCDVPLLLSKAIYYVHTNATLDRAGLSGLWERRGELLARCEASCPSAGDTAVRKMQDIAKLKEFWQIEGASCQPHMGDSCRSKP
ncbi:unnamed protein product [Durusdinium trenchii]|uniref:Uncharacterized protein n=1 Tax=Durusdinium trenchii TaxID=1381693 RepID=A0ABP0P1X7_9DINO